MIKMIGTIIVAHENLAEELAKITELIVGQRCHFKTVSVGIPENCGETINKIEEAITEMDTGEGIVLFTDMFGGGPSNLGISFLHKKNMEVITGVNLSMLIRMATLSPGKSLPEVKTELVEYGRKDIRIVTDAFIT